MKDNKFAFDKFVKDIVKKEDAGRKRVKDHIAGQAELPLRIHNKLHREHWQNSTRFTKRKK
jgi:hypothetical protein|tara:strand:+ start:173 stop:355 length:183 start_codon:yes stop_codon:yes gene_type:complete